jgi:hypothetical protein
LNFFRKFTDIFAAQGAHGKNHQSESFNYFAWTPLFKKVNM